MPPLIEAADTGPFFHNNSAGPRIEDAVNFYGGVFFGISPPVAALDQRFGAPLEVLNADQAIKIARFLRVLNTAYNASLTIQRLEAVQTPDRAVSKWVRPDPAEARGARDRRGRRCARRCSGRLHHAHPDGCPGRFHRGQSGSTARPLRDRPTVRNPRVSNALTRMRAGRGRLGANINFLMGQGNLMF